MGYYFKQTIIILLIGLLCFAGTSTREITTIICDRCGIQVESENDDVELPWIMAHEPGGSWFDKVYFCSCNCLCVYFWQAEIDEKGAAG